MTSPVYTQPELPLAEAALAEHTEKTGHEPLKTTDGWVCLANDDCYAAWPPLSECQIRMEKAQKDLFLKGSTNLVVIPEGLEVQVSWSDPAADPLKDIQEFSAQEFHRGPNWSGIQKGYN